MNYETFQRHDLITREAIWVQHFVIGYLKTLGLGLAFGVLMAAAGFAMGGTGLEVGRLVMALSIALPLVSVPMTLLRMPAWPTRGNGAVSSATSHQQQASALV